MDSDLATPPRTVAAPGPELVAATGMIVALALTNTRLEAAWQRSLRELTQARAGMLVASDVVRRKVGQDLHDGAQQRLIAIQIRAEMARERTDDQELAAEIDSIATLAAAAVDDLRELAHGIYPESLVTLGLGHALRATASISPTPVRVDDRGVGRCPAAIEAAIYFCSLEAIQNATKHAGPQAQVVVTISREPDGVSFEIADDGCGMQPQSDGDGIGLRCMRDRIGALGGRLEIRSSPGAGTRVCGYVPVMP